MRHLFFTEAFYSNPILTLDTLNQLVKDNHVKEKDIYKSGQFLSMRVFDNDSTRSILSKVIADMDAYIAYTNSRWGNTATGLLSVNVLQDKHCEHFGYGCEIMWDAEGEQFIFRGMLDEDDD